MNKKQYQSPTLRVVALRGGGLLAGSNGDTVSGRSIDGSHQLSRERKGWNDDEE